jgi:hypothetical protein
VQRPRWPSVGGQLNSVVQLTNDLTWYKILFWEFIKVIPCLFLISNIQYSVHKRPPLEYIPSQINPVQNLKTISN